MISRALLLGTLCALLCSGSGFASELVVVIQGIDSQDCELQIELYGVQQRPTFPYAQRRVMAEVRIRAQSLQAPGKQASASFGDLSSASYSVSVIHYVNGNSAIDRNLL